MYIIRNKRTGEFAARSSKFYFKPCGKNKTPHLYSRYYDAETRANRLFKNNSVSVCRGFAAEGDVYEVVEVELL